MLVKILGTGCTNCKNLEMKVRNLISEHKIDAEVSKITDLQDIMAYGIMRTPGLVINEKVVSYGSVPKDNQILQWISEAK